MKKKINCFYPHQQLMITIQNIGNVVESAGGDSVKVEIKWRLQIKQWRNGQFQQFNHSFGGCTQKFIN